MVFDLDLIKKVYEEMPSKIAAAKKLTGKALTLSEKILYSHLYSKTIRDYTRGKDYVDFAPDRVAMQDATAQMALLQFSTCGRDRVAVPSTVHCDHLIQAKTGAKSDLTTALDVNKEVYDFLASVSNKYGIGFWKPGAGIIHLMACACSKCVGSDAVMTSTAQGALRPAHQLYLIRNSAMWFAPAGIADAIRQA
jgi:aconitate hydratase